MALFRRLLCTFPSLRLTGSLGHTARTNGLRDSDGAAPQPQPHRNWSALTTSPPAIPSSLVQAHTRCVRTLKLPRGLATFTSFQRHRGSATRGYRVVCASSIHTWGALEARMKGANLEGKPGGSKGSGEHGSVLAQFVGKTEEPKQVTVGTKGQWTPSTGI